MGGFGEIYGMVEVKIKPFRAFFIAKMMHEWYHGYIKFRNGGRKVLNVTNWKVIGGFNNDEFSSVYSVGMGIPGLTVFIKHEIRLMAAGRVITNNIQLFKEDWVEIGKYMGWIK